MRLRSPSRTADVDAILERIGDARVVLLGEATHGTSEFYRMRTRITTVSLANGKSEAWICDRTGHRSSQMIARYKRTARTFSELHTGTFVPMATAVPELNRHGIATGAETAADGGEASVSKSEIITETSVLVGHLDLNRGPMD